MNINNRITKLEKTRFETTINRLRENINAVSDNELEFLFELFATEREKRGLVEKPEIEAARHLLKTLTTEGMTENQALESVLDAARNNGFELTADDILGAGFRL